jgi:amino acid adenylation domain-containing protein
MECSDGHYALSFEQEQLWFLDQLRSGAREYLLHWAFRLRGQLDRDALTAALTEIANRHEVLRTRYTTMDGVPVQVVDEPAPVDLAIVDLTGCPPDDRDERVYEIGATEVNTPIDLRISPWRLTLVQLARHDAILMIMVHHIAFDHWSLGILTRELRLFYTAYGTGEAAPLEPLAVQYADYAEWQRERWRASDAALTRHVDYWRGRLAGLEPVELPTDRPRPAVWDATGELVEFVVPAALARELVAVGRMVKATPFMVFLTAFGLLIGRYCGKRDFGVGVSIAGRGRIELEQMVGTFVNTVVQRTDLAGDVTFAELLARTRKSTLDAFDHQDVPLQRLVAELVPDPDLSRNPLFQVSFVVHNAKVEPLCLPDIAVEEVPTPVASATFDITLHMAENVDGSWTSRLTYPTALFDRARIERMAANYLALLANLGAAPKVPLSRVPTVSEAERTWLLGWNHSAGKAPEATLPDLFRAQARATPDAVAVVAGDTRLTYAELVSKVDCLAKFLRARGVVTETPVGVAMHGGTDLVVALLGTLAAGAVYVPLSPDLPAERLRFMLADAGVELVITQAALREWLPQRTPVVVVDARWDDIARSAPVEPVAIDAANAAYVMYTSGSTGRPKGVVITHGGIRNRVLWSVDQHGLTSDDRVLQKTTIGFDASVWEFLAPLVSGGGVVMAPEGAHRDSTMMVRAVAQYGVTVLQLVPSVLQMVVNEPELADCTALRLACSGGEPLPAALCERLLGVVDVELYNTYGPTECSVDSTAWRYERGTPDSIVSIGAALPNVEVFVVDADDRLVPIGVRGELCVSGAGIARGYVGRGDLTAERFTPNPFATTPGTRWYRTGDLARWRGDGTLEFLGRVDDQVKIRGVRVEPGEVRDHLVRLPGVRQAAVVAREDLPGDVAGAVRLVGYVVGIGLDPAALRAELVAVLPDQLVPAAIVVLPELPRTPSGKIDTHALPAPEPPASGQGRAPSTPDEVALCALFAEVLGVPSVSVDDGFFALGGHSLLVIRLISRVRVALGKDLTVPDVFGAPTVTGLAGRLRPLARPPMRRRTDNGMPARVETAS